MFRLKYDENCFGLYETQEECWIEMCRLVQTLGYPKPDYYRTWRINDNTTQIDFGSWSHFCYIVEGE